MSANISTNTRPICRSRCVGRASVDMSTNRHIDRYHMTADMSVNIAADTLTVDCRLNIDQVSVVYWLTVL